MFSRFAEAMHATTGSDAETAYDIWLSNTSGPTSHGLGRQPQAGQWGATRVGHATQASRAAPKRL